MPRSRKTTTKPGTTTRKRKADAVGPTVIPFGRFNEADVAAMDVDPAREAALKEFLRILRRFETSSLIQALGEFAEKVGSSKPLRLAPPPDPARSKRP